MENTFQRVISRSEKSEMMPIGELVLRDINQKRKRKRGVKLQRSLKEIEILYQTGASLRQLNNLAKIWTFQLMTLIQEVKNSNSTH